MENKCMDDNMDEESLLIEAQPVIQEVKYGLTFDDIMINLKILSKLRTGDKLFIQGKFFNIQSSYTQRLWNRFLSSMPNNRYNMLFFLNEIYDGVFATINECIQNTHLNNQHHKLIRVMNEMLKSGEGLNNLKSSYEGDITTQARIDYILDQIDIKSQDCLKVLGTKV